MITTPHTSNLPHHAHQGTFASYTFGFVASIILTLIPYEIVTEHLLSGSLLIGAIIACAIIQLTVQMICFLHLSSRSRARWNLMAFVFTVLIIWIVVIGSLWIMNNLARNMTSAQLDAYMHKQN